MVLIMWGSGQRGLECMSWNKFQTLGRSSEKVIFGRHPKWAFWAWMRKLYPSKKYRSPTRCKSECHFSWRNFEISHHMKCFRNIWLMDKWNWGPYVHVSNWHNVAMRKGFWTSTRRPKLERHSRFYFHKIGHNIYFIRGENGVCHFWSYLQKQSP